MKLGSLLALDLKLDGAHVPESRALDEEQDGHLPVFGPGLAKCDAEGLDDSDAAEYEALGNGSAAEENADLCHGEANKEDVCAGVSVEHNDLGDDIDEENDDLPDVGEVTVVDDDVLGEEVAVTGNEAVAAVSAYEHGDLLHPESAATQVPIPRPMRTEVSWRVQ